MNSVYLCRYHKAKKYGSYDAYTVLCVCNCESSAFGICLAEYRWTSQEDWTIQKVPTECEEFIEICDESYCP